MKKIVRSLWPCLAALSLTFTACEKEPAAESGGEELDDWEILQLVNTETLNTAYYKDIFLDGGCELNPGVKVNGSVVNGLLPYALDKTGITRAEYFFSTVNNVANGYTDEDLALQTALFSGTEADLNGVLLYPDGEPRFRMLYCFGGHSGPHGTTLGAAGRKNVQVFYTNGGSYAGSCAGAFLAGRFANKKVRDYFNIWLGGNMNSTGVSNSSIEIEMVSDLFGGYYGPGNGTLVTGVRHNGGGYMDVETAPAGTVVLALFRNQNGKNSSGAGFYGQPAVWAYKPSPKSGRLVVTGSHPEDADSGDILNLTASMFRYAWDGSGRAKVKSVLHNGETKTFEPGIGDLQCHHYVLWISDEIPSLSLSLEGEEACDMELYLKKDGFAFPENKPDYSSAEGGARQSIRTGILSPGLWYVTIRCATTVTATEVITNPSKNLGRRFVYSGNTAVLNGIPYTVRADW